MHESSGSASEQAATDNASCGRVDASRFTATIAAPVNMIEPTYYVGHPDGTFSAANPQPTIAAERARCAQIARQWVQFWNSDEEGTQDAIVRAIESGADAPTTPASIGAGQPSVAELMRLARECAHKNATPANWFALEACASRLSTHVPVRALTDEEVAETEPWPSNGETMMARIAKLPTFAAAIQRKFCEVNGLVAPARLSVNPASATNANRPAKAVDNARPDGIKGS